MNDQVTQYIQGFDPPIAARLQQLREYILKTVPQSKEVISYAMPAYNVDGKILVYFAGYKNHIGLYPGHVENYDFSERVRQYASGKSTLQFKNSEPLPLDVIEELLEYRLQQIKQK